MKKIFICLFIFCFYSELNSQTILNIPTVIQEQNQWCWAGSTKSVMDYYGTSYQQCQIAEFTRTVAVWHNFGASDCCVNPSAGCNYWNYNWGNAGSMEDILNTMASISSYGSGNSLSMSQVTTEISAGRPFIIRWGWTSGGGHFIVGKGFDVSNNIYYMNPWPGEGAKVSTYSWMLNDGNHTWTHTNVLTTNPPIGTNIKLQANENGFTVFPNPAHDLITIRAKNEVDGNVCLFNLNGKLIFEQHFNTATEISTANLARGVYLLKIVSGDNSYYKKIILD